MTRHDLSTDLDALQAEAREHLGQGRVLVRIATARRVRAVVADSLGALVRVSYAKGRWTCTCRRLPCSHRLAVQAVTTNPPGLVRPSRARRSRALAVGFTITDPSLNEEQHP